MIKAVIFDFYGVLYLEGTHFNEELLEYIRSQLKSKYKIGIISNSSGREINELLSVGDKALFDVMVFSGQLDVAKPHPDIYKIAAQKLGVQPEDCVFVDDDDYRAAGAQAAGMQGIVYQNFNQFKEELAGLVSNTNN